MRWHSSIKKWITKLRLKRNRRRVLIAAGLLIIIGIVTHYMTQPRIDPSAYKPLLDTIAKGESRGNYNAYFGNGGNTTIRFTNMTISQVLKWQQDYVNQGKASNAVGRYQFLGTTLQGLMQRLRIHPNARFDEALQDRLAIALIEKRGVMDYVQNKITREQFAANLAKEWAALPKITEPNPEQSYYAKDGLNKALISIGEIYAAIDAFKK